MKENKRKIIVGGVILAALIAVFGIVYFTNRTIPQTGSKNIVVEAIGSNGATEEYKLSTDAAYLRIAMDELVASDSGFSYDGTDGEFGIMIEYINGERASYTEDGAYWALYVNGEYGQNGCDTQPVADGDVYTWKYEKAQ
ncbi:MAG: DUF4430 domain-containing protein [Lachnospiraceae bacterium]|nr:DUF4430 domain-containing protein [Lachnospiraceae bacterium]